MSLDSSNLVPTRGCFSWIWCSDYFQFCSINVTANRKNVQKSVNELWREIKIMIPTDVFWMRICQFLRCYAERVRLRETQSGKGILKVGNTLMLLLRLWRHRLWHCLPSRDSSASLPHFTLKSIGTNVLTIVGQKDFIK